MASSPSTPPQPSAPAGEKKRGLHKPESRGMQIAAAVAALWVILFLLLNSQTVTVHFVLFSTRIALVWALALSAIAGAVIGVFFGRRRRPHTS
jgi:uncharacterized integral membrane protein